MKKALWSLLLASSLVLPAAAGAALITYDESYLSDGNVALTNWAAALSLEQFNPVLGTLNSVTITNDAKVQGVIKFESLDAAASTVTGTLGAKVKVTTAAVPAVNLEALPSASRTAVLTAFDGTFDWGGASGRTFPGTTDPTPVEGTGSDSDTFGPLTAFIGTGFVVFNATAEGNSTATGSGNLVSQFTTMAGTKVTVTYDYTPAVPEPGSLLLLGSGLGSVFYFVRRRTS